MSIQYDVWIRENGMENEAREIARATDRPVTAVLRELREVMGPVDTISIDDAPTYSSQLAGEAETLEGDIVSGRKLAL